MGEAANIAELVLNLYTFGFVAVVFYATFFLRQRRSFYPLFSCCVIAFPENFHFASMCACIYVYPTFSTLIWINECVINSFYSYLLICINIFCLMLRLRKFKRKRTGRKKEILDNRIFYRLSFINTPLYFSLAYERLQENSRPSKTQMSGSHVCVPNKNAH